MEKYLKIISENEKMVEAQLGSTEIYPAVFKEGNQMKFRCTCRHFSVTTSLCSHVISLLYKLGDWHTEVPIEFR